MREFIPIDEVFEYKGKKYKVVKSIGILCTGCAFWTASQCYALHLDCTYFSRIDNTSVIFKEVT